MALENELNAIRDVRLGTLLCIVTADWAFQVRLLEGRGLAVVEQPAGLGGALLCMI